MGLRDKFEELNKETTLNRCQKVQEFIDNEISFCYTEIDDIIKDLFNEIDELKKEISIKDNRNRIKEELGDVFFVLCNLANYFKINAEKSIDYSINEFERRFIYMENRLGSENIKNTSKEKLNKLWKEAKMNK